MSKSPLETAQQILDQNLKITFEKGCLTVAGEKYTPELSRAIIKELEDMQQLALRCTMICDPTRAKLENLLACAKGRGH